MPCSGKSAGRSLSSAFLCDVFCTKALCHVDASLLQDAGAGLIRLLTQRHAGGGQVIELKLRVGVPVGGRALQLKEQVVLRSPQGFPTARRVGRSGHEVGPEKTEDLPCRFGAGEDQGDAGTDQVRKSKNRADVVIGLEHAIKPDMFFQPQPCFDDV